MFNEYSISVGLLFIVAITISLYAVISTRRALAQHTNLLKDQSELVEQAKRTVRADLHKRVSVIFEKAVEENAEYLKDDIEKARHSMVTYVKREFDAALSADMRALHESVDDIQHGAVAGIDSIQKSIIENQESFSKKIQERQLALVASLEQQHKSLTERIDSAVKDEKTRRIKEFENQMTQIVRVYINEALSNQIDVDAQIDYIIEDLQQNKNAMIEDMKHAA